jgi:hypothetical protein
VTTDSESVDLRRRGGWLPDDQDALESWLAGHRERVAAKGEQVPMHPVMTARDWPPPARRRETAPDVRLGRGAGEGAHIMPW